MWLIDSSTLTLREFLGNPPEYAILSHVWAHKRRDEEEQEELSFKDFRKGRRKHTQGYKKIKGFCEQAKKDGLRWCWADTVCIDKRSSAELSESINSMFAWYRGAKTCYVFMQDVEGKHKWSSSEWWTRGWTLQELIAPKTVEFYDRNWNRIGNKIEMAAAIHKKSGIPDSVLKNVESVARWTIAQRISWAAGRKTTRLEDRAYSLLGLFGINMPLLYGEGKHAFRRLQIELLGRYPDESVLGWSSTGIKTHRVLAQDPDEFREAARLEPDGPPFFTRIDSDIRDIGPPRATSWGIELHVTVCKLHPREAIEFKGQDQNFLLALPLTSAKNGSIRELPCTLVLIRSGPAPYCYLRHDCIFDTFDNARQQLKRQFRVEEGCKKWVVYLQTDDNFSS